MKKKMIMQLASKLTMNVQRAAFPSVSQGPAGSCVVAPSSMENLLKNLTSAVFPLDSRHPKSF